MCESNHLQNSLLNTSHPNSEDELRKKSSTHSFCLLSHSNQVLSSLSEKISHDDKNLNIFNYLEYHIQNPENENFCDQLKKMRKSLHIRALSLQNYKETHGEFLKKVLVKMNRTRYEFLKNFVVQIANCRIFRIYKDYYPKVCFDFLK